MLFKIAIERYFNDYRYITSLVKYRRSKQKLTRIKVANDLSIPFTSYRRIEEDPDFRNLEYISRVVKYFNINDKFDKGLISKLNHSLELFIHAIFYDFKIADTFYREIVSFKGECKDSFLMMFINLTELIYHIHSMNKDELLKMDDEIDFIDNMIEELAEEHRFVYRLFKSSYYALLNDKVKAGELHIEVLSYLEKNHRLSPFVYSQLCSNYILLQDWTNALFYAVKSRNLLFETDNYYKLIQNRLAHAEIFYYMRNYEEALNTLNSLSAFLLLYHSNVIPDQYLILHCCLLIVTDRFDEAFNLIDNAFLSVSLLLIKLYLYYLCNDKDKFNDVYDMLNSNKLDEIQSTLLTCMTDIINNNLYEVNYKLEYLSLNYQHNYLKHLVHLMKIRLI